MDRSRWVSQDPTAPHATTLNMGMWSVERDPLRVKNSAEAVGNGFLDGFRSGHLPHYQGGVWGNQPSGLSPPDPSLPGELCHPACLPLLSLWPTEGS